MRRAAIILGVVLVAAAAAAIALAAPHPRTGATGSAAHDPSSSGRPLPSPLYGVTVDDVSGPPQIAASLRHLPEMPATRLYFDVREPASHYRAAVRALRPVSYLMGELLDSSDEEQISVSGYHQRVASYLSAFAGRIDLWEIGNEVNGSWAGPYPAVRAKLVDAYRQVSAGGGRTALTLYYNAGCGDGRVELDPLTFSREYVPPAVRSGLGYVFLSYYEEDCHGLRPDAAAWRTYFSRLHVLYPHARLGFGEVGMRQPVGRGTLPRAESILRYYYGLRVGLPYYVGGYFWWYYREDCVPYLRKPLWRSLRSGFEAQAAAARG